MLAMKMVHWAPPINSIDSTHVPLVDLLWRQLLVVRGSVGNFRRKGESIVVAAKRLRLRLRRLAAFSQRHCQWTRTFVGARRSAHQHCSSDECDAEHGHERDDSANNAVENGG
jgi:hypothetical protein